MLHQKEEITKFLGKDSFELDDLQMCTRNLQSGANKKVHIQFAEYGPFSTTVFILSCCSL
ncbi:hypothetical protein ASF92_13585 [Pedobacter sp. Leaf176]|nr:hypothetical protein ASF92_13585 [Pedobacter sp. Leaf176]